MVIVGTFEVDIAEHAKRRIEFRDGKVIEDHAVENRIIAVPREEEVA